MTTAERIKRARLSAGLTQEQLAQRIGVAHITASRWERGAHVPLPHQFRRIADATSVALTELVPLEADSSA